MIVLVKFADLIILLVENILFELLIYCKLFPVII